MQIELRFIEFCEPFWEMTEPRQGVVGLHCVGRKYRGLTEMVDI